MAKTLLITTDDIKKFTPIGGNVDTDKIIPLLITEQDTNIQSLLGTELLEKVQSDIDASTLTGEYATLVNDYVKPTLYWGAFSIYLSFAPFTIGNGGLYQHRSENSDSVSLDDAQRLAKIARDKANYYRERCEDYLCFKQSELPEYNQNTNEDVYPTRGAGMPYPGGFQLD